MFPKSFGGICCTLIHAVALGCAAVSLYFFVATSIERMLVALLVLGMAIALEVIAVLVSDGTTART